MIHEKIPLLSSSFQCFSCNSILGCKVLPDRKILIYCINCLTFKIFSLNEDLLINNLHLQNNNTNEILCKKCNNKLGDFFPKGNQCSCGSWQVPAIQIVKSKVDKIKYT